MIAGPVLQEFDIVIEQDEEGYFVASVPSLPGCYTQARSLDVLMKRVKEAIEVCMGDEQPDPGGQRLRYVGIQRVTVDL